MSLTKRISMICASCFKEPNKVAYWFKTNVFLCRTCWTNRFNKLNENEKKEYMFYDN